MDWQARAVACRLLGDQGEHYWPSTEQTCRYCGYTWDDYQIVNSPEQVEREFQRIMELDKAGWSDWTFPGDVSILLDRQLIATR